MRVDYHHVAGPHEVFYVLQWSAVDVALVLAVLHELARLGQVMELFSRHELVVPAIDFASTGGPGCH